ncbi:MAG: hypothetical protein AAFZ09_05250 [Pseudomonadota bacterium]
MRLPRVTRPRRGRLRSALLAACAVLPALLLPSLLPDTAAAGAWTREPGDGVVITSIGRQATPQTLFTLGPASPDKTTAQVYAEYGLTEKLTLGASLFSETRIGSDGMSSANGAAFLRVRLHRDDQGNAAAVQIGAAAPLEELIGGPFGGSQPESTAELRISGLAGTSWWGDWGSVFVTSAAGLAWRSENAPDELRGELTAGYKIDDCCMAILGSYLTVPVIGEGDTSYKLAPSFAYSLPRAADAPEDEPRRTTFQLGLSLEAVGEGDTVGLTFSIWRRF